MKKAVIVVLASISSFLALNTLAQSDEPTPEDLAKQDIEVRQSIKKLLAWNNRVLYDTMRRKREFNAADMEEAAHRIAQLAAMLPDAFAPDTREFNIQTRALDSIWTAKEDFDSKAENLEARAKALAEIAAGGDQRKIFAELRTFGPDTCGDCHDTYRGD